MATAVHDGGLLRGSYGSYPETMADSAIAEDESVNRTTIWRRRKKQLGLSAGTLSGTSVRERNTQATRHAPLAAPSPLEAQPPDPSEIMEMATALAATPRNPPLRPPLGARLFAVPLARGKPSLADHAIAIITSIPSPPLDETYECRVLWRDPIDGTPVQVRDHVRFMVAYANAFRVMCPDEAPPKPYLATDFDLLAECDRCSLSAMGFQLHGFDESQRQSREPAQGDDAWLRAQEPHESNCFTNDAHQTGRGIEVTITQFTFTLQISLGSMF